MSDATGFSAGEEFAIEWHMMPLEDPKGAPRGYPYPGYTGVCVLRIRTIDGTRTVRRDKIDGISRLPTGATHRAQNLGGAAGGGGGEVPVMTSVLLVNGESISLGGTRIGTSDALHAAIEKAWLGDGFDPFAERAG